ncbi:MAG TPA: sensor domain-containing diguanylate cyclase [Solirubrobacteraceae bacterium]|nr:sensor domain-containing diguanylate cyclase [Solirubrobacteraceae bacterium]
MDATADHLGVLVAPVSEARGRRLTLVDALGLLDRVGDPALTALARLAQAITGAGAAAVHVFDADFQHRIAGVGAPLVAHPAPDSMCRLVIEDGERIITADAAADVRFEYSSFVKDPVAPVRFYASMPLHSDGGIVVGTLCTFDSEVRELNEEQIARLEDVAQLACSHLEQIRIASELGKQATLDALTGAVNRLTFEDRLAQALARRRRRGTPVVVALLDLDDFKAINDTHGHRCGDAALQWVARRLHDCMRSEDTVGRIGGDEFAVVAEVADRDFWRLLQKLHHAADGFDPPLSISVGSVVADDRDDVAVLMRRLDQAMCADKLHGKRSRAAGEH